MIAGKRLSLARPNSTPSQIAWSVLIALALFLVYTSQKAPRRLAFAEKGGDEIFTSPRHGHFHPALFRQGISHDDFHVREMKERLLGMVRHHNQIGIVGVEGGHDVIHLASRGYQVEAFEPMTKYINSVRKWSSGQGITGVNLHHCAAGNVTGGYIVAQYNTGNTRDAERVPRKRVDDVLSSSTGLDVLSADIQGGEWDVLQGASRIIEGAGIRSMWIEIHPCNPRVPPMLEQLDKWGYSLFDMVPFGGLKGTTGRTSALDSDVALAMDWHNRPSEFKEYFQWMCTMKKRWNWLQADVLAIQRQLVTPQFLIKLNSLSRDVLSSKK